jgi:hypothetical protein
LTASRAPAWTPTRDVDTTATGQRALADARAPRRLRAMTDGAQLLEPIRDPLRRPR